MILSSARTPETRAQGHEMPGKVSAVHRRYIVRRQRLQRLRVVPVVEMPLVPFQGLHRVHRIRRAHDKLAGRDVAEVVGRQIREQRKSHVRRRRPMRDARDRVFLEVVRRKPLVVRPDEALEERPCPARELAHEDRLSHRQPCFAAGERPADPPCDTRREEPEEQYRCGSRQCERSGCSQQDCDARGEDRRDPHRPDGRRQFGGAGCVIDAAMIGGVSG